MLCFECELLVSFSSFLGLELHCVKVKSFCLRLIQDGYSYSYFFGEHLYGRSNPNLRVNSRVMGLRYVFVSTPAASEGDNTVTYEIYPQPLQVPTTQFPSLTQFVSLIV